MNCKSTNTKREQYKCFSVKFLHNAYTTEDYKYQVSGFKLKNALIWLKTLNNGIKIMENFK